MCVSVIPQGLPPVSHTWLGVFWIELAIIFNRRDAVDVGMVHRLREQEKMTQYKTTA